MKYHYIPVEKKVKLDPWHNNCIEEVGKQFIEVV